MKGFFILEVRSCTIADVSVMDIEKGSLTHFAVVRIDWVQQEEAHMVVVWYLQSWRGRGLNRSYPSAEDANCPLGDCIRLYKNQVTDTTFVQVYFATVCRPKMIIQDSGSVLQSLTTIAVVQLLTSKIKNPFISSSSSWTVVATVMSHGHSVAKHMASVPSIA